jgi:hypothetical protein
MPSPSQIGFIVLPPAHGKTKLHCPKNYVYDASTVFDGRSTVDLEYLYQRALNTGFWMSYYQAWSKYLAPRLLEETGRIVVMVPHEELGQYAGWTDLGGLILHHSAWHGNFKHRLDTLKENLTLWNRESLRGAEECSCNAELVNKLLVKAMMWANTDF